MFEERHQRCGHGDELLGADVDVVDFGAVDQHKVPLAACIHQVFGDDALLVELDVGLGDGVLVLFPRGKIEAEGDGFDRPLAGLLQPGAEPRRLLLLNVVSDAQSTLAGVGDLDKVEDAGILYLAVRRLDETELVDARKTRERADEADVRAFRRLDGADAAIVGGVHVAHLEARTLSGQAARSKCRQAALVRDLGERIGLVHELRKLRGAEELTDGRHHRLGVDQVVRHSRGELLIDAHLFLDGALHADEADAELVLHQLAHGAHAAVAEVIDVVHHADVLAQLEQVADGRVEVLRRQGAMVEMGRVLVFVELDVELQPAHAREVVLAGVKEHALEERRRGVERRRVAGTQLAVDFDQRFLGFSDGIALQGVGDDVAYIVALGEEDLEGSGAAGQHLVQAVGGQLDVGFDDHFAGGGIHNIGRGQRAIQFGNLDLDFVDGGGANRLERVGRDLAAGVGNLLALGQHGVRRLGAHQVGACVGILRNSPKELAVLNVQAVHRVESLENLLVGTQPESAQEDGSQELAFAVDADVKGILLVVLELDPRAAIGNDLAQEVGAVVGGLEKHAGRAVQLRNDHTLGSVHDKCAVRRHERNVAEKDFLLLDVLDGLVAGLRVFLIDCEAHGDLERSGEGHAPLFALLLVVLQLQAHRVAALVAEIGYVLVVGAALLAEHVAGKERIGNDHGAALHAGGAQMMQPFQVAALALPIADREVHKVQLRNAAEVGDRENRHKYRLQAGVVPLVGQLVHLQKALVRTPLHFDQVGDLGCGRNL